MATHPKVLGLTLDQCFPTGAPRSPCAPRCICMMKHSHFPYTSTYSSTRHNTNRKHNIHHTPYTNIQHSKAAQKPTTFKNARYTTNFPTDPNTVTTTDIKANMRHIHTSVVFTHLATRGNNKILRTPPPHIISSEDPRLTSRTLVQHRTNKSPFLKSYLHKVNAKTHPSPLCLLCNTHIISSTAPTYAPHGYTARVTALLARWTEKLAGGPQAGRSDSPH